MTNEIAIIKPTELEEVIKSSGLQIQEGEEIKQSYLPYLIQLAEIQEQSSKINYDLPTAIDETIARELRLKTVKIRTGASDLKDSRKKIHLLKGNLEQASYNLIAASCKLAEETFVNVEKAREIAAKKAKSELHEARLLKLSEFCDNAQIYPLGDMTENDFDSLISGMELAKIQKEAADKAIEDARLLAIETERAETLRIKLLNEKLEAEKLAAEKALELERAETARLLKVEQDKRDAEIARQKAENEKRELELAAERKIQADLLAKQQADADAKLEIELAKVAEDARVKMIAEEAKQVAYEMQVAKDAKIMTDAINAEKAKTAKLEADAKVARDLELAKIAADKVLADNAAKAPDKEKLVKYIDSFSSELSFHFTDQKAMAVCTDIQAKFKSFKVWAKQQIETI